MRALAGILLGLGLLLTSDYACLSAADNPNSTDPKSPREEIFTGDVQTTRDANRTITSVKLVLDFKETIQVKLDEKGRALGQELENKRAEVTGTVEGLGSQRVLTVTRFHEARISIAGKGSSEKEQTERK